MNSGDEQRQAIRDAFQAGSSTWQCCDWAYPFPLLDLDLCGLKSVYAQRMARATCGRESRAWQQVASLLQEIEEDARLATVAATDAVAAADRGDMPHALRLANLARDLEAKWHTYIGWQSLVDTIAAWQPTRDVHVAK